MAKLEENLDIFFMQIFKLKKQKQQQQQKN